MKTIRRRLVLLILCTSIVGVSLLFGFGHVEASDYIDVNAGWCWIKAGEVNQVPGDITIVWSDPGAQHPYDIVAYPESQMEVTVTIQTEGVVFSDSGTSELIIALPRVTDPLPVVLKGQYDSENGYDLRLDIDEDVTGDIDIEVQVVYVAGGQYLIDETEYLYGKNQEPGDSGNIAEDIEAKEDLEVKRLTSKFVIGAPTFSIDTITQTSVTPSYLRNGRSYIAIRDLCAALGIVQSNLDWDPLEKTVTIIDKGKSIKMQIGNNLIFVDNNQLAIGAAPEISNGCTMIPVALIAPFFDAKTIWDAGTNTITIQ